MVDHKYDRLIDVAGVVHPSLFPLPLLLPLQAKIVPGHLRKVFVLEISHCQGEWRLDLELLDYGLPA